MAISFQCPNCGAIIPDREDKCILECAQCGTTVTKYIKQTDQLDVNLTSQATIRNVSEEKKQQRKKIEAITELITVIAVIAFFIFMFVGIGHLGK